MFVLEQQRTHLVHSFKFKLSWEGFFTTVNIYQVLVYNPVSFIHSVLWCY